MKMTDIHNFYKEPDFFIRVNISSENKRWERIPCKIFLPDRKTEKPRMVLLPESDWSLNTVFSFAFESISDDDIIISAPIAYTVKVQRIHWKDKSLTENVWYADPQHLIIANRCRAKRKSKTDMTLWISPNSYLSPPMLIHSSYLGGVKAQRVHSIKTLMDGGKRLAFNTHFENVKLSKGESLHRSCLVATLKTPIPAINTDEIRREILTAVDDLLLLVSFASGIRTACLGWTACDGSWLVEYYRGEYRFPSGESETEDYDEVVPREHFEEFLRKCHPKFLKYSDREILRRAMWASEDSNEKYLEHTFLSKFKSLERVIFVFKHDDRLKKNLQELYSALLSKYKIDVSDLWPVFGKNGLESIRNRIAHGEPLLTKHRNAMFVAEENIGFILKRVLIAILGWQVEKTEVSKKALVTRTSAYDFNHNRDLFMSKSLWKN